MTILRHRPQSPAINSFRHPALKTLRSSTFKLALIWIGIFGALVLAL
jgi:hypothetical protein